MSAKFYWYPDEGGGLSTITLAKPLTEMHEKRDADRVSAYRGDGSAAVALWLSKTRVRIVLERGLSAGNVRDLKQLEDHLQRGLPVGFAREHTKAVAAFGSAPKRGETFLTTFGQAFAVWEPSAALVSGDEVAIESDPPTTEVEIHAVTGLNSTTGALTLSGETILHSFSGQVIARHRDFYPALRMPDDQLGKPIVSTERRLTWTLDVELEVVIGLIAAGYADGMGGVSLSLSDALAPNAAGRTLQDVLYLASHTYTRDRSGITGARASRLGPAR